MSYIIGYLGCTLSSSFLFPQLYKTYTTKKADDLSYAFLFTGLAASILWEIYGISIIDYPVITSSAINLLNNITLISLKYTYRHKKHIIQEIIV